MYMSYNESTCISLSWPVESSVFDQLLQDTHRPVPPTLPTSTRTQQHPHNESREREEGREDVVVMEMGGYPIRNKCDHIVQGYGHVSSTMLSSARTGRQGMWTYMYVYSGYIGHVVLKVCAVFP